MSEAKFTKGMWVSTYEKGGLSGEFKLMAGTKVIVGGCGCCESPYMEGDDPAADAHLIAAAPELYTVLAEIVDDGEISLHQIVRAEKALAKARGEV